MKSKIIKLLLVFQLVLCGFSTIVLAQKETEGLFSGDNCETMLLKAHIVFNAFEARKEKQSFLIIIVGAAKDEKALYNKIRIKEVIKYFNFRKLPNESIVYAEGEPIDNFGYIRFYVDGKLVEEIYIRPKANFCSETQGKVQNELLKDSEGMESKPWTSGSDRAICYGFAFLSFGSFKIRITELLPIFNRRAISELFNPFL